MADRITAEQDPFAAISIFKDLKSGDASAHFDPAMRDWRDKWCVARFVHGNRFGWPLRKLASNSAPCGGDDAAFVFFASETVARSTAEQSRGRWAIAEDRAFPATAFQWRALLSSHWDGSCEELYRGDDFGRAYLAFAMAQSAVVRAGGRYLVAHLEGVVDGQANLLGGGGLALSAMSKELSR